MNLPASLLDAQTTALLRRLAREQESRVRRVREEAETQAAEIVRRARAEARTRVRQAIAETRRTDSAAIARRRAALDTQSRRARQGTLRDLLERAWAALPAALQSRWSQEGARLRWCDAACAAAGRSLLQPEQVQVELDATVAAALGPVIAARMASRMNITVAAVTGLGAGLRLRAGNACVDATLPGLLAARERITAELLAEFERRVGHGDPEPGT
jgi:vacuolar-type H+-ATPase subunit E/Vma4